MEEIKIAVAAANFSHAYPAQMLTLLQATLKPGPVHPAMLHRGNGGLGKGQA